MKVSSKRCRALVAMTTLLVSATVAQAAETTIADGKLTFSGYADLRYSNYTIKDNGAIEGNPRSGFGVEDGAFYSTFSKDNLSFVLDVPFRRFKNGDDSGLAGDAGASNNQKILFGGDKAQIYGKYKIMDGLSFAFGQWDTFFGVELNDSKDRVFGRTGLVYDSFIPVTHTGALVEYTMAGFTARLAAANPNNKGSFGDNTNAEDKTEYGASVGWANEMFHGQFGYLTRSKNNTATPTKHDDRVLMDAIVGITWQALTVDLEYANLDDPGKNTLTADATDSEDKATGWMILASYKFTDDFAAGLRYEMIDNDPLAGSGTTTAPTTTGWKEAKSMGATVHYNVAANLQLRAEYDMYEYKRVTETAALKNWDEKYFALAALVNF